MDLEWLPGSGEERKKSPEGSFSSGKDTGELEVFCEKS